MVAPAVVPVDLVPHRVLLVIVLVVLLGGVELRGVDDLGHDGGRKPLRLLQGFFRRLGKLFLLLVVVEDRRSVLVAVVAELGVPGQRVYVAPEDPEQLLIRDFRGVVDDLHGLGVPRPSGRHFLVGRVLLLSPRVSHRDGENPVPLVERGLHAPETAAREGCRRRLRGLLRPSAVFRCAGNRGHQQRDHHPTEEFRDRHEVGLHRILRFPQE